MKKTLTFGLISGAMSAATVLATIRSRSWPFTVLLASYRAEIGKGPGRVRVACYICDPMIRLSNAAKACQAGVIPMGTDRATVAKTTGAAHMVERWMRRIEMTS